MAETELRKQFFEFVQGLITKHHLQTSNLHSKITTENIFQDAVTSYRDEFNEFILKTVTPESKVIGIENLIELHKLAQTGKSCLILGRHLGNFDVPNLYCLIKKTGNRNALNAFNDIVFIAGRKLNEEHPVVLFLTSMFPRIVIIPKGEDVAESTAINMAAQRLIKKIKTEGKILLLYPTGTRERSWDANSLKGIKETYNYIKSFDKIVFQNMQGNNLLPSKEGMIKDEMICETIVFTFSSVYDTTDILNEFSQGMPENADKKQFVVDKVMEKIRGL